MSLLVGRNFESKVSEGLWWYSRWRHKTSEWLWHALGNDDWELHGWLLSTDGSVHVEDHLLSVIALDQVNITARKKSVPCGDKRDLAVVSNALSSLGSVVLGVDENLIPMV